MASVVESVTSSCSISSIFPERPIHASDDRLVNYLAFEHTNYDLQRHDEARASERDLKLLL